MVSLYKLCTFHLTPIFMHCCTSDQRGSPNREGHRRLSSPRSRTPSKDTILEYWLIESLTHQDEHFDAGMSSHSNASYPDSTQSALPGQTSFDELYSISTSSSSFPRDSESPTKRHAFSVLNKQTQFFSPFSASTIPYFYAVSPTPPICGHTFARQPGIIASPYGKAALDVDAPIETVTPQRVVRMDKVSIMRNRHSRSSISTRITMEVQDANG